MYLTVLGNSSAAPTHTRNQSAQVLTLNNKNYLLDCGEGTQGQLLRYKINQNKVSEIFISHLHPDHFTGLIGFITTQNLRHRTKDLHVFGPEGIEEIIQTQLYYSQSHLHFSVYFHTLKDVEDGETIFEDSQVKVECVNLIHRITCFGFIFREKSRKRKMKKQVVKEHPPPVEAFQYLELGKDYKDEQGNLFNADFYTHPYTSTRSFAYITDTLVKNSLTSLLNEISLLYHEATFGKRMEERASETYHTTSEQAARLAQDSKAKTLVIGHFSARYNQLEELLNEARLIFKETYLAIQGERFTISNQDPG